MNDIGEIITDKRFLCQYGPWIVSLINPDVYVNNKKSRSYSHNYGYKSQPILMFWSFGRKENFKESVLPH